MKKRTKLHLRLAGIAFLPALLMVASSFNYAQEKIGEASHQAATSCADCHSAGEELLQDDHMLKMAKRMQKRLEKQNETVSLETIAVALHNRNELLARTVRVTVLDASQTEKSTAWNVSVKEYPELLAVANKWTGMKFSIDTESLEEKIRLGAFSGSIIVQDVLVEETSMTRKHRRAVTNVTAREGFEYDAEKLANEIVHALSKNIPDVTTYAMYREPKVIVRDENGERELTLLASGESNFENSPESREANVHKVFTEHLQNTFVAPGEVFSFNDTLDGPVTLDKGWKEALGLFGGGAAMTPGGGICQGATTVFRAAMLAGLPFVEERNHSLYVTYYEKYGVGVDATIFPGVHDLRFRNDTGDYILFQAYTMGKDAFVDIYGIDDGRTVQMEGPYFAGTKPRPAQLRALGYQEIGWVRTVTAADGSEAAKPFISTYAKPIPRYLSRDYHVQTYTESLRGVAPQMTVVNN